MLGAVRILEAVEWDSMLFKAPEIIRTVYKLLKEHSVEYSALLVNIQTLSVATQSLPLQPLPKHPKSGFSPFKTIQPLSNFVSELIEIHQSSPIFSCHLVASSPSYIPSCPNTLCLERNPCRGADFTCIITVKP